MAEEIPRMPMLWFEPKLTPVCPDFAGPIKQAIYQYYGESGNSFDREISKLEQLRNEMCRAPPTYEGCALLKRYYSQVYGLVNRFSKEDWRIGVQCAWADIYTNKTVIGDLDVELASTLYNIGVHHIVLGGTRFRKTSDEIKVSCTHFQCAAWAFQHLMDNRKLTRSNDLPDDLLRFCVQISLAQAQVCILEKSMLDKRKPGVVARVASQVVEYYRGALGILEQSAMNTESVNIVDTCGSKLFRSWKKIVELKIHYYWAIFHSYMGDYAEEQQKFGERVGWFESADYRVKEAGKLMKERDCKATESAVKMMTDIIAVKLTNAKKENDFIYHEKVVPADSLEELKGGPLVKGIPFSVTDPEILVEDIFARLVPIEAHETASIFSDQLDQIRRQFGGKMEEYNHDLAVYLSALQLERASLRSLPKDDIPDELIEICASLSCSAEDLVEGVEKGLRKLDDLGEAIEKLVDDSKRSLEEGEVKGQSLIRAELGKELAKHEETHLKAVESNRSLWENFDRYKEDIRIMSTSSAAKIEAILPSNRDVQYDEEVCKELERLFDKIDEMKRQRDMLYGKLVKQIEETNVLKYAVAHSKPEVEAFFKKETERFKETGDFLEQNFAAQKNILAAMTKTNAQYGETRKSIMAVQKSRQTRIAGLLYSREVFQELQTNSEKGTEFYTRFKETLVRLNARIRGVCKVQEEEMRAPVESPERMAQPMISQSQQIHPGTLGPQGYPGLPNVGYNSPSVVSAHPGSLPSTGSPAQVPGVPGVPGVPPAVPGPGAKLKDYLAFMKAKNAQDGSATLPVTQVQPQPQLPVSGYQQPVPPVAQQYHQQPPVQQLPQQPPAPAQQYRPQQPQQQAQLPAPANGHYQSLPSGTVPGTMPYQQPAQYAQPPPQQHPQHQPHQPQQPPVSGYQTLPASNVPTSIPQYQQPAAQYLPQQPQQLPPQQPVQHPQHVPSPYAPQPAQQLAQQPQMPPANGHYQQVTPGNVPATMSYQPAAQYSQQPQQAQLPPQNLQSQPSQPAQYGQQPQQAQLPPQSLQSQAYQQPAAQYAQPQQSPLPARASLPPANPYQSPLAQSSPYAPQPQQHAHQLAQHQASPQPQMPPANGHYQQLPATMAYQQPGAQYVSQSQPQPQAQLLPQQYPQPPVNIHQQLENEPKLGWAVLTPTKAAEKQLPDILSTMSISGPANGQVMAPNNGTNGTQNGSNGTTNGSNGTANGTATDGKASSNFDILSQFDPLSN